MNLLNIEITKEVEDKIINSISLKKYKTVLHYIEKITDKLYKSIPESKRTSYGRVYVIKLLSNYIYKSLLKNRIKIDEVIDDMFKNSSNYKNKGVCLGIASDYAISDYKNYSKVLPYFEISATDIDWNVRELSQIFFRKLIKTYPEHIKPYLLKLVKSKNPYIRRFVAETLRPVKENKWIYENPDYSISIIKYLFKEKNPYPRTSVGNNLSDLSKKLPDFILNIVKELVNNRDKNSYWIAYRACRNLIKKESEKVFKLLKIEEYKYKKKIYKKDEY